MAEVLCVRLGEGMRCCRHVPEADDFDIDRRIGLGDLPAVYDALVEAIRDLQDVADAYGDAIGDAESLARVQAMRAKCRLKRCNRD